MLLVVGSVSFLYTTHSYGIFPAPPTSSSGSTASTPTVAGQGSTYATINTTSGVIEVQLFPNVAPKTVANFVSLANSGFYNHLVWHRIVKDFAIQTGDPTTKDGGGDQAAWGSNGSPRRCLLKPTRVSSRRVSGTTTATSELLALKTRTAGVPSSSST